MSKPPPEDINPEEFFRERNIDIIKLIKEMKENDIDDIDELQTRLCSLFNAKLITLLDRSNFVYHGDECEVDFDALYLLEEKDEKYYITFTYYLCAKDLYVDRINYKRYDNFVGECFKIESKDNFNEDDFLNNSRDIVEIKDYFKTVYGEDARLKYLDYLNRNFEN